MLSHPILPILKLSTLVLLATQCGCTHALRENRRLLNKHDAWIRPESTASRIIATPLCIPIATGALVLDVTLIHPSVSIAPAARDMYGIFWDYPDDVWVDLITMFPFRAAGTALLFPPDWIGRSFLVPIPSELTKSKKQSAGSG